MHNRPAAQEEEEEEVKEEEEEEEEMDVYEAGSNPPPGSSSSNHSATRARPNWEDFVTIVTDKTTSTIGPKELLVKLRKKPECVVVAGSIRALVERGSETGIQGPDRNVYVFPGSGPSNERRFQAHELTCDGIVFTHFWMVSGSFSTAIPDETIAEALRSLPYLWSIETDALVRSMHSVPMERLMHGTGVVMDKDVGSINERELQKAMSQFPHCLLVPGSRYAFDARYAGLRIEKFPDRGFQFQDRHIYGEFFACTEHTLGNRTFVYFGACQGGKLLFPHNENTLRLAFAYRLMNPEGGWYCSSPDTRRMSLDAAAAPLGPWTLRIRDV